MLNINMEFRKGILFVRLDGELTKKTVAIINKEVISKILKGGINNVVYNLENLKVIDLKGIHALLYTYELNKNNHGTTSICGINANVEKIIRKSRMLNYVNEIGSEIKAFSS